MFVDCKSESLLAGLLLNFNLPFLWKSCLYLITSFYEDKMQFVKLLWSYHTFIWLYKVFFWIKKLGLCSFSLSLFLVSFYMSLATNKAQTDIWCTAFHWHIRWGESLNQSLSGHILPIPENRPFWDLHFPNVSARTALCKSNCINASQLPKKAHSLPESMFN